MHPLGIGDGEDVRSDLAVEVPYDVHQLGIEQICSFHQLRSAAAVPASKRQLRRHAPERPCPGDDDSPRAQIVEPLKIPRHAKVESLVFQRIDRRNVVLSINNSFWGEKKKKKQKEGSGKTDILDRKKEKIKIKRNLSQSVLGLICQTN